MKKLLGTFIAAMLLSTAIHIPNQLSASADSATTISLQVDEKFVKLDTYPEIQNGSPFLPLYMTREWSGVKLKWDQKNKVVTILVDGKRYEIKNGSRKVVAGNTSITLDTAAYIVNGRVMVPASLLEDIMGAEVNWQQKYHNILVKSQGRSPLAVDENRPDIRLYGMDEKDGIYHGIVLEVDGKRHPYNWKTPLSWKEDPQLFVKDLNQDGKPEVVVLLNQGSGTGIHSQDVHVISTADFKEIPVETQKETIAKWVTTELKQDSGILQASIRIKEKGSDVTLRIPDLDYVEQSEIGFGAVVYHNVEDGKLVVTLGGAVSMSTFIGDLKITYAFEKGRFVAEKVQFMPIDEYKQYIQK